MCDPYLSLPLSGSHELEADIMGLSWLQSPWLLDDVIDDVIDADVRLDDDSLEQKLVFIMLVRLWQLSFGDLSWTLLGSSKTLRDRTDFRVFFFLVYKDKELYLPWKPF